MVGCYNLNTIEGVLGHKPPFTICYMNRLYHGARKSASVPGKVLKTFLTIWNVSSIWVSFRIKLLISCNSCCKMHYFMGQQNLPVNA